MSSVTKKELAETLFEKVGINRKEAKKVVDIFFEEISRALLRKEEVHLSNFGQFETRQKNARPGRNPRANTPVTIAARRSVIFHASPKLKETVENSLRAQAWQGDPQ